MQILIIPVTIVLIVMVIGTLWYFISSKTEQPVSSDESGDDILQEKLSESTTPSPSKSDAETGEDVETGQEEEQPSESPPEATTSIYTEYPTIQDISEENLANLEELARALPKLPNVTMNLLPILAQPGAGAKEVAQVIETDQTTAARMLRWVNSSLFGLESDVTSLKRAVVILGMDTVRSLVLEDSLNRDPRLKGIPFLSPETIWRHAAAVSVTAKHLGRSAHGVESDVAATAGLLHNIGLLLLLMLENRKLKSALDSSMESNEMLIDHEHHIFGFNHQIWSECFISAWRLPEEISSAIGKHHSPMVEPFDPLAAVIWLSDYIVSRIGYACPEGQIPLADDDEIAELMSRIGLRPPLGNYMSEGLIREIIKATKYWTDKSTVMEESQVSIS